MTKEKKGRIGIGNIISLAGLALLGFFTFMGALMLTSGNLGAAAGIAVATVIVMSLLLGAAVYCKKADTDFTRWKKVEIAALVVFVAAAVYPARYVMHFFDVMSHKEELQKAAAADADNLRGMFRSYEEAERSALAVTTTGLQNAFGEESDINVRDYYEAAAIKNYEDIESWMLNERRLLLGDTGAEGMAPYLTYKHNADSLIAEWAADVKVWDVMAVGRQSKVPGELAPAIADNLTKRSQSGKLPVIVYNDGVYELSNANQTVTIGEPELVFEKSITTTGPINVVNIIIYIVIIAMIAVQYMMTPRSEKTEIGDGQNIMEYDGVNRL
ncbi:MAG: hypothetical protein K2J66_04810 [Muribaculaceae bacterium]|nr:hypothetical protein [Muribaculaceae bacterium]